MLAPGQICVIHKDTANQGKVISVKSAVVERQNVYKLGKHREAISAVTFELTDIHDSGSSMLSLARLLAGT